MEERKDFYVFRWPVTGPKREEKEGGEKKRERGERQEKNVLGRWLGGEHWGAPGGAAAGRKRVGGVEETEKRVRARIEVLGGRKGWHDEKFWIF